MYSLVKGTHDVILDEADRYTAVEYVLTATAKLYGYREFRTPILEHTELFLRSVGNSSDIVRKEMYTFMDKSERSITLRPEITAGTIRSIVNNKLLANQDFPLKAYYIGPNFRYERPQQGRYRQFNQFGVECVGVVGPERDAEVIILGYHQLDELGFENVTLKINTLGDEKSREDYKEALKQYFSEHLDEMCSDCKERFKLNILRILDCKVENDRKIIENAPKIIDYLTDEAKQYFETICKILDESEIPYVIDHDLVRGLDYYSGPVFEFHYTSKLGKNYGAIGAGGHYGKLVKEVGGPDVEGCGFAMGIERLVSVMTDDGIFDDFKAKMDVYLMPLSKDYYHAALCLANDLRSDGYVVEVCLENKGISQMFKKAERRNARYAGIIGETEILTNTIILKNLETKEQITVPLKSIIYTLEHLLKPEEESECCCGDDHEHECCCGDDDCCCEHNHEDDDCCCGHDHEHDDCCCGHNHEDDDCCCEHDDLDCDCCSNHSHDEHHQVWSHDDKDEECCCCGHKKDK